MQRTGRFGLALGAYLAGFGPAYAQDEVTVYAAASLTDALTEIAQLYEADTGDDVVLVFGASSTLARQASLGAPVDLIVLADDAWAAWLSEQTVVAGAEVVARNRLAVLGPTGTAPLEDIADLLPALDGGVLAMAQIEAVPAGRYGQQALTALGQWDGLAPHVVQGGSVRAALRFVERGEARFGIGYESDARALDALDVVFQFPTASHDAIVYPGAVITGQGDDFLSFLQEPQAQQVLARWGFEPGRGAP